MSNAKPISSFGKKGINENPYENREGLVYCRVSSKRQETEGSGLKTQEGRSIQDLKSISVPHIKTFSDSYSGGGDFMKRPAMRKMFEYIDTNPHKEFVVVFDDLKRFARDVEFHWKLKTAFKSRNVLLRCLNYNFDESPEGKFAELIMSGQAELERSQNARQVVQKQKARLMLGYHPFGAKRGYRQVSYPEHGKLSIRKEPDATYLQEALEGFSTGIFQKKVDACRFLVKKGLWENQKPEKYITKFSEFLADPFYAGYVEYPKWEVGRINGKHEGLITQEVFDLNQKRLANESSGKQIRVDISPYFPLRGLLICSTCNSHITGAFSTGRNKKHPYYFCQKTGCCMKGKTLNKKIVEDRFDTLLKEYKLKSDVSKIVEIIFDKVWSKEVSNFENDLKKDIKNSEILSNRISKLTGLILDSKSKTIANAYENELEKLEQQRANLEERQQDPPNFGAIYRTALSKSTGLLKNPYKIWSKLDPLEKQKLFFFLFDQKLPYSKKEGYRTANIPCAVRLFEEFVDTNSPYVEKRGVEPRSIVGKDMSLQEIDTFYPSSRADF